MVQNLIHERMLRHDEAIEEVSSKHAEGQVLTGPILTIPYINTRAVEQANGDVKKIRDRHYFHVLPEQLKINGDVTPQKLKRGIYDYQYVTADLNDDYSIENESWIELEGNDWKTKNEYYIFLYYNSPEIGDYDKIIGYTQINSGSK